MDNGRQFARATLYGPQFDRSIELTRSGLPLYFSALSPLEKDLSVRAGDLGAAGLLRLQKASPEFAEKLEEDAIAATWGDNAGRTTSSPLAVPWDQGRPRRCWTSFFRRPRA